MRYVILLAIVFFLTTLPVATLRNAGHHSDKAMATLSVAHQPQDQAPAFVPGQVLARLSSQADRSDAEQIAASHGYQIRSAIPALNTYLFGVPEGQEATAIDTLRAEPTVVWAEADGLNRAMQVPNDTFYRSLQWNLRQIGLEAAWDVTRGDASVVVAVLDTGVDPLHPDLAASLVTGYDFVNDSPEARDDSSHGTHAAGIVAARGNNGQGIAGIAWDTKIMPIKVLNARGLGPESALISGLLYAVDQGARIINISSGTTRGSTAMAEAVAYAHDHGALIVSAAGNNGDRENPVIYPAAYPEVLAVGATDKSNVVAPFSERQSYVSVVAPGVDIPSTAWEGAGIGPYAMATGTSAAAPHVSGLAALIWSLKPGLTHDQVRQLIIDNADDLGAQGRDPLYGFGLINAARTISALRPQTPGLAATPTPRPQATAPTTLATPEAMPTLPTLPTLAPLAPSALLPGAPSDWYFAEGSTKTPFDTWLHVFNPNPEATEVRITYQLVVGQTREQRLTLAPNTRGSIYVNQVLPQAEFSMRVRAEATVFAERAMFFGHDGHVSTGVASPSSAWYFAEGRTMPPYDTWILLQNPHPRPVTAKLTFYAGDGTRKEFVQLLPPSSRGSLYVDLVFPSDGFSTTVVADAPVVAEQATYFDQGQGGYAAMGIKAPAKAWYLAEGSTRPGFQTQLILFNPGDLPAEVKVRYLREQGESVQSVYSVPARGRTSVAVADLLPDSSFGAKVESSVPIVVARVIYFGNGGLSGHGSTGVSVASQDWYFAEGSTKPPFKEYLAVLNPNPASTNLEVTLFPATGGQPQVHLFQMRAESRLTLDLNHLAPNADLSARVRSTKPIVVERSMYFGDGNGGTDTVGIAR